MLNINTEINNGALFCAQMKFEGSDLTVSVNGRAKSCLTETLYMFIEYFQDTYPDKKMQVLKLFLTESDMHAGARPWQVTHFNS